VSNSDAIFEQTFHHYWTDVALHRFHQLEADKESRCFLVSRYAATVAFDTGAGWAAAAGMTVPHQPR